MDPLIVDTAVELAPRAVVHFAPSRPLLLIDATGFGLAPLQDVINTMAAGSVPSSVDEIFNCSDAEYGTTQAWGAWLRRQEPQADGIQWTSRQNNRGQCVVLFEDRCGGALQVSGPSTPLMHPSSEEAATVDRLLSQLGWSRT